MFFLQTCSLELVKNISSEDKVDYQDEAGDVYSTTFLKRLHLYFIPVTKSKGIKWEYYFSKS